MYSYEDRLRAVELYIKLGKRVRATIRQVRYPLIQSKNSAAPPHSVWEHVFHIELAGLEVLRQSLQLGECLG